MMSGVVVILLFLSVFIIFIYFVYYILNWINDVKNIPKKNPKMTVKFGKNIKHMGLLSEIYQELLADNNAPIIHGFEIGNDYGFENIKLFWNNIIRNYINFRCVPMYMKTKWYWKELNINDIDLNEHCFYVEMDVNGNDDITGKICEYVSGLNMNKRFNENRPHFECYYIKLKGMDKAVIYTRLHHSIGDGILLNKIISDQHSYIWGNDRKSSDVKVRKKGKHWFGLLISMMIYLPYAVYDVLMLVFFERNNQKYFQSNSDDISDHRLNMYYSTKMNLQKIKELSKKYHKNGTVNDMLSTIFCEGIYKYLVSTKKLDKNNKDYHMRFVSIFNMRSLNSKYLAKMVNNAKAFNNDNENDLAMVPIRLPCYEMTFKERFQLIHNQFYKLKYGPSPYLGNILIKLIYKIGGLWLLKLFVKYILSKFDCLMSNLMGSKEYLPLKNGKVLDMFNTTNPVIMPMSVGIMSYVNDIIFTITIKNDIKESKLIIQSINDVYNDLL